jgi:prepilin-type N-terminal cleavage/methylation domain-containing protein
MKSQKGFTLVEMVIVIAVIGTLMGLVFNGTQSIQANARDTKRIADLKKVQTYLELYYNKCNHYPGANGANCSAVVANPVTWDQLRTALIVDSVADAVDIPEFDPSRVVYQYGVDAPNGFDYVLGATMEKSIPAGGIEVATLGVNCGMNKLYCLK